MHIEPYTCLNMNYEIHRSQTITESQHKVVVLLPVTLILQLSTLVV